MLRGRAGRPVDVGRRRPGGVRRTLRRRSSGGGSYSQASGRAARAGTRHRESRASSCRPPGKRSSRTCSNRGSSTPPRTRNCLTSGPAGPRARSFEGHAELSHIWPAGPRARPLRGTRNCLTSGARLGRPPSVTGRPSSPKHRRSAEALRGALLPQEVGELVGVQLGEPVEGPGPRSPGPDLRVAVTADVPDRVVCTRGGRVVTVVVALGRLVTVAAAAALAASVLQISESSSKSSTGRTLRHFWQRRQFAAIYSPSLVFLCSHPTNATAHRRFRPAQDATAPGRRAARGRWESAGQYSPRTSTTRTTAWVVELVGLGPRTTARLPIVPLFNAVAACRRSVPVTT